MTKFELLLDFFYEFDGVKLILITKQCYLLFHLLCFQVYLL